MSNVNSDLLSRNGILYRVAGFYSDWDTFEFFSGDYITDKWGRGSFHQCRLSLSMNRAIRSVYRDQDIGKVITPATEIENVIKNVYESFGLKRSNCIEFDSLDHHRLKIVLVKSEKEASIFDKYEKDFYRFIKNYLVSGGVIHPLRSNIGNSVAFARAMCGKVEKDALPITKDNIYRIFGKKTVKEETKTVSSDDKKTETVNKNVSLVSTIKNSRKFKKLSDKHPIIIEDGYTDEMKQLREQICKKAEGRGGFVKFDYAGTELTIPKKPFLNWILKYSRKDTHPSMVWHTLSPSCYKTDSDCTYHTDWWIGAGIPLYAYKFDHEYDERKYAQLNEMLYKESDRLCREMFKPEVSDKIYYLGGTQCPESEMRVVAESYTTKGLAQHLPIQSVINLLEQKGFKVETKSFG